MRQNFSTNFFQKDEDKIPQLLETRANPNQTFSFDEVPFAEDFNRYKKILSQHHIEIG